jgi:hypothetical protein
MRFILGQLAPIYAKGKLREYGRRTTQGKPGVCFRNGELFRFAAKP